MISTQKVILMAIFMNILIGVITTSNENTDRMTNLDTLINQYDDTGNTMVDTVPPQTQEVSALQKSVVGNEKKMGLGVWDVVWNSINPFSMMKASRESTYSVLWLLATGLTLFRIAIIFIMGYEIWQIFFAKKQS